MKTKLTTNKYLNKKTLIKLLKDDLKFHKKAYIQFCNEADCHVSKKYKPTSDMVLEQRSFRSGYIAALQCTINNIQGLPCDEVDEYIGD